LNVLEYKQLGSWNVCGYLSYNASHFYTGAWITGQQIKSLKLAYVVLKLLLAPAETQLHKSDFQLGNIYSVQWNTRHHTPQDYLVKHKKVLLHFNYLNYNRTENKSGAIKDQQWIGQTV
jgi:hypothetical protein